MKNIFIILMILLTFVSCDTAVKSELQTGIIEGEDAKSLAVDGFNAVSYTHLTLPTILLV